MKPHFYLSVVILTFLTSVFAQAMVIDSITRLDVDSIDSSVSETLYPAGLRAGSRLYEHGSLAYGTLLTNLLNADFIRMDNSDSSKPDYQLRLTLSAVAQVFLFIDERITEVPASMAWVQDLGFAATGLKHSTIGTSNNARYWIYSAILPSGSIILGANGNDGANLNMYTVAATSVVPEPAVTSMMIGASLFMMLAAKGLSRRS